MGQPYAGLSRQRKVARHADALRWVCVVAACSALFLSSSEAAADFAATDVDGCLLWLKAESIRGLRDGERVDVWPDSSGHGRDATGSGQTRPSFQERALNGHPVVRFRARTYLGLSKGITGHQTAFVVYSDRSDMPYTTPLGSTCCPGSYHGADSDRTLFSPDFCDPAVYNGWIYKNGRAVTVTEPRPKSVAVMVYISRTPLRQTITHVGSDSFTKDTDRSIRGDIAEIILYDRALSADQMNRVGWYLQEKYDIDGHYTRPSAAASSRGGRSTASVDRQQDAPAPGEGKDAADVLADYRGLYERAQRRIEETALADYNDLMDRYDEALSRLVARYQSQGNLDASLAARGERKRLARERRIEKADADTTLPEDLRALRDRCAEMETALQLTRCRRIVALAEQYVERLEGVKVSLTQNRRIEDALQVHSEIEAVEASPAVRAGRERLATAERDAMAARVSHEQTGSSEPAEPYKVKGITVYPPGARVDDQQVDFRREPLDRTPSSPLASPVIAKLETGSERDRVVNSSSSYYRRQKTEDHRFARVALRLNSREESVEDAVVYIEYFSAPYTRQAGKVKPEVHATRGLELERLDGDGVTLDLPGVLFSSRRRYRNRRYDDYDRRYGVRYYGIGVSVFDRKGNLLYQGVTSRTLEDLCRGERPRERSLNTDPGIADDY